MDTYANNTRTKYGHAAANHQRQALDVSSLQLVSDSPDFARQHFFPAMVNRSAQVGQLMRFQEMANQHVQAGPAAQLKKMVDAFAAQNGKLSQRKKHTSHTHGAPIQRKVNHTITLQDIHRVKKVDFENAIKSSWNKVANTLDSRTNKKWDPKEPGHNMGHTLGNMVDLYGNVYKGHSIPAKQSEKIENQNIKGQNTSGVWNVNTICAEQNIIKTYGSANRYIFSLAKDGNGYKPACSKCASGKVLGAHNIVDGYSKSSLDDFFTNFDIDGLYTKKANYLRAYWKGHPGDKIEYIQKYVDAQDIRKPTFGKNTKSNRKRLLMSRYNKKIEAAEEQGAKLYSKAYSVWEKQKPKLADFA